MFEVRKIINRFLTLWSRGGSIRRSGKGVLKAPMFEPLSERSRKRLPIPGDDELLDGPAVRKLAAELSAIDVSRRHMVDWLSDVVYGFNGEFVGADGQAMLIPDIDDEFPQDDKPTPDSYKWISDFLRWADREPKQAVQRKVAGRVRFIKMAMAVIAEEGSPHRYSGRLTVRGAMLADLGRR